jgi:O-6-methylguanine DNA methyltransferase
MWSTAASVAPRYYLDMDYPPNFDYAHRMGTIYGWFSMKGLTRLELPHAERGAEHRSVLHSGVNDLRVYALKSALERYFSGLREDFSEIPLDLDDASEFQREVWEGARTVPWGLSMTYGELTTRLKKHKSASRAVGHALGQNRIAIVIPCHRFIGADGKLHGFAAGLAWKRELLALEGILLH